LLEVELISGSKNVNSHQMFFLIGFYILFIKSRHDRSGVIMKNTLDNRSSNGQLGASFRRVSYHHSSTSPYVANPSMEQIIMKALFKSIPMLLVTLSLIFLVACSSEPKRESAGEYLDDSVITTRVKAAILAEDTLKVSEINVETYKGVVQLSGFVSSRDAESKAVKVARGVKGVKSVKDDMRVK
jgi:hyperosmotically inducible protein